MVKLNSRFPSSKELLNFFEQNRTLFKSTEAFQKLLLSSRALFTAEEQRANKVNKDKQF